jgi:uncharacterized protein involved in type VI secretion and phage assembly
MTFALLHPLLDQRSLADATGRVYGVAVGIVTDNADPDKRGRVKVRLPWLGADAESAWARIVTPMAGAARGVFFLPDVDDEVLVAFEHGDVEHPYVLGALWNGQATPPADNADGKNAIRLLQTGAGLTIRFDDTSGAERLEIADKDGKEQVVIDMAAKKVSVTSSGDVEISASDGKVAIAGKTVEISSSGEAKLTASGTLDVEGQTVNVKGKPAINLN